MSSTQKLVGEIALGALVEDIKGALANKANSADVYTQTETDEKLDKKANTEGEYDYLTSGLASNLKTDEGATDKTPYLFRKSGGSVTVGKYATDKLVGGTVAWNQLFNSAGSVNCPVAGSACSIDHSTGKVTFLINEMPSAQNSNWYQPSTHEFAGHVVFMKSKVTSTHSCKYRNRVENANISNVNISANTPTILQDVTRVTAYTGTCALGGFVLTDGLTVPETITIEDIVVFDLTAMFGSTIADYIYSLEQATAGAGVAFFKRLFPLPYYEYNAGELMSVKTSMHKTVGFNAWDEITELGYWNGQTGEYFPYSTTQLCSKNYIPIVPNTNYFLLMPDGSSKGDLIFYDADKNFIRGRLNRGNQITETPENAYFMHINLGDQYGAEYKNNVCVNISWDGERNGEYEPYEVNTYTLDDVELRGLFKLDSNNKLYADGDTYESSGDVGRKYTLVDLGTLDWAMHATIPNAFYTNGFTSIKQGTTNFICIPYENGGTFSDYNLIEDKKMYSSTALQRIAVKDTAFSDATTFKTSLSGKYLVCELATPTTETADTFTNPQQVDKNGTEEYVDNRTVPIPVGHSTFYLEDLKTKLENAPDNPTADGDYIVRRNGGTNEYFALPTIPNTDGTYSLKCTVSSGTPSLSWVADE